MTTESRGDTYHVYATTSKEQRAHEIADRLIREDGRRAIVSKVDDLRGGPHDPRTLQQFRGFGRADALHGLDPALPDVLPPSGYVLRPRRGLEKAHPCLTRTRPRSTLT